MDKLLREKEKLAVARFVIKNFSPEGKRIVGKRRKKAIKYHLDRIVGSKDNVIIIMKDEGVIGVTEKGSVIDV